MRSPRFLRTLSHSLIAGRWLSWIAAAWIASAAPARGTPIASQANIPYSGIAPGSIDMATGELILVCQPDLRLDGPMPLSFGRYYGSMLAREGFASGHLGPNWLGSYDWSLSVGAAGATVVTNRGEALQFQPSPVGGWNLVSPTDQNYRLDFTDRWWRLTDPSRHRVYLFDGTSHLLSVILDAHGNGLNLIYAGAQLMQVNDGSGRALSFEYDFTGKLTRVSDGTRGVNFSYTGGVLASVTDAAGGTTNYAYTGPAGSADLLQSASEPAGNTPLSWSYDALGRVVTITDAEGHSSSCAYDTPSGNVWTDALGHSWTYVHDSQSRLMTLLDPAGGTTTFSYDPLGRLATSTRPMGDATSFSYDAASGYLGSVTGGDGTVFSFSYSAHGVAGATLYDLAAAHYPDGASESFARDASGNLTDWTDRGGFHWTSSFNSRGEPLTLTNPAGGVTTRTYDGAGLMDTEMDNAGHTTSAARDAFGRVTKVTWGDGTNRQFAYDNLDHLTSLLDERGKSWTYDYDANGRISQVTDPLTEHQGFHHDAEGRLTQVVDALGNTTLYAFDAAGQLASFTDRTGVVTQYQHDALGRLARVIDPAGGARTLSYDGDGRVPAVQDALGHTASFQYDAMDRVTHLTDPVGSGTDFAYDAMGRALSAAGPLGRSTSASYDARGLATSFTAAASETDFGRTALGEIASVTDPNHNGWPAVYDLDGRMTSSADPLARVTGYAYDAAGRMTHATLPLGSGDFGFDAAGRPTTIGFSDGTLLTYAWDDANRAIGGNGAAFAYDAAGRMTSSNGLAFTRDAEGRITSESYGPAMVVNYGYDAAGRLASVHDWLGGTTSFAYDTTGALVSLLRPNGASAAYQYDAAGRLADLVEKQPGPINTPALAHIAITRDALGEPVSIDRAQPLLPGVQSVSSTTFGYDAASQINGDTYDAMGRLIGDGARTFQWDGASRLAGYAGGGSAPQYAYDAFGRPLSRTMGATSEQYVWNYADDATALDEVSAGGVPKTFYIHTPSGLLLYAIDAASGARTFYHFDENGSTIFLTDDAAAVQTKYAYSPFGAVTTGGPTSDNPFTLGGATGVMAIGGGLYRMGGGIYDSKSSRMISGGAIASGGDPVVKNPGSRLLPDLDASTRSGRLGDWQQASGPQPLPWFSAQGLPHPWPWIGGHGTHSKPIDVPEIAAESQLDDGGGNKDGDKVGGRPAGGWYEFRFSATGGAGVGKIKFNEFPIDNKKSPNHHVTFSEYTSHHIHGVGTGGTHQWANHLADPVLGLPVTWGKERLGPVDLDVAPQPEVSEFCRWCWGGPPSGPILSQPVPNGGLHLGRSDGVIQKITESFSSSIDCPACAGPIAYKPAKLVQWPYSVLPDPDLVPKPTDFCTWCVGR